jgi:hypothetical protein
MGNIFRMYGEMRYAYPKRRYHLRGLEETEYEGEDWIQSAQESDLQQALVKMAWAPSGFFLAEGGGRTYN